MMFMALFVAFLWERPARAETRVCDGPEACCPAVLLSRIDAPRRVSVGVVLNGLANVNERAGTWDADYYLYESWEPTPGFTPQTGVVNEITRQSQQFDVTELHDGHCTRSRRLHSTLQSSFDLRTFPFDEQRLSLEISDEQFASSSVFYDERPLTAGLDARARTQLTAWRPGNTLEFAHAQRAFEHENGRPNYDYASFTLGVRRHVTFHLIKFFLPLFVIVAIAFSAFWIDPEDLNSRVNVGVTCMLAAIAFQFAEGSTLPEVSYLTLADRVYAACYIAVALSLFAAIFSNALVRRGDKPSAMRLHRWGRVAFPAGLAIAVLISILRAVQRPVG